MFSKISSNLCLFLFICFLSIQLTLTLKCYECDNCKYNSSCSCTNSVEVDTQKSYCILLRETILDFVSYEIKHEPRNITKYYIYDPYYISVEEVITHDSATGKWKSISNKTVYACQTDNCNKDDLLKHLPENGLSLMLPEDWLNKKLLRQAPEDETLCRDCDGARLCGDSPSSMNLSHLCSRKDCQGFCVTGESYETAESKQFCYTSLCPDTPVDPAVSVPNVAITAVYYIRNGKFEIVELDVTCNANDCTDFGIFQEIKDKIQKNLDNVKAFLPNHTKSIYSTSMIFLMIILFFQIFITY
jgi:hypothetical protein